MTHPTEAGTMSEYHKITTIYNRDPENNHRTLIEGDYATEEFRLLKDVEWVWTEKVDGTNIRVMWDGEDVRFGGRTDRARIPTPLLDVLMETFTVERLTAGLKGPLVLYGEGYGPKIQSGGRYRDDPGFILFDALAGEDIWLERETVEEIADALEIDVVPIVGRGTPAEAVEFVREGFVSPIAKDTTLTSEGVVMRPTVELRDRMGRRIISKVKHKDFTNV